MTDLVICSQVRSRHGGEWVSRAAEKDSRLAEEEIQDIEQVLLAVGNATREVQRIADAVGMLNDRCQPVVPTLLRALVCYCAGSAVPCTL